MNLAALLRRLEEERNQLAAGALSQPAGRDSFEYGRVCGMYAGLKLAADLLLETQRDAEERTFNL